MGKSKEISQDIRKKIVELHESGTSLGAISKCLKVPRSSVQTIIWKVKNHGTTQSSYRSGRRHVLSPEHERILVRKMENNPKTTANDLVKMMKEKGTKVSLSTVKRVLSRHDLKGYSTKKTPLLQNHHENAGLQMASAHGDKELFGEMSSGVIKQEWDCVAIMTVGESGTGLAKVQP